MGMFDVIAPAADTTDVQAGGMGFLESFGMAATAGVTGAMVSGVGSIYNTAAEGINLLGGSVETVNTYNTLDNIDHNWAEYYKRNQNAIDVAGFIGTSLIPGMAGIKALNLARAGSGAGAIGRGLGYFQTRQAASLSAALGEMAIEGGSVFTQINRSKAAAMAWGAADQTLQAAAFETAVALTMKQSPLLADDSWWDIGKSAFTGAVFGGVIGGGIDALILNKSFKQAVGLLEGKQRTYDALPGTGLATENKFNLAVGDKSYAIMDSLQRLPEAVLESDKLLALSFHVGRPDKVTGWNPISKKIDLNIEQVLDRTLKGTEKLAINKFEESIRQLAPKNEGDVVQPFVEMLLTDYKLMRDAGKDAAYITERMGDRLLELKSLKAATSEAPVGAEDLYYFKRSLKPEEVAGLKTVEDYQNAVISNSPLLDNAYKDPYVFLGTSEQRLQAFKEIAYIGRDGDNGFPSLSAAWAAGRDVAINADGTIRVNDASKLWSRKKDPVFNSNRFLNTRSGAITEDAVLTAADRARAGTVMTVAADGVRIPLTDKSTKFIKMTGEFDEAADTTYYTARHAWASQLSDDAIPTTVRVDDFSLMDRLRTVQGELLEHINIVRSDGSIIDTARNIGITDTIRSAKLSEAQRIFADAFDAGKTLDVREVAYRLNVDGQWLEQAVASRFQTLSRGPEATAAPISGETGQISLPLDSYKNRENLIAEFERPQQFRELNTITPDMPWKQRRDTIIEAASSNGGQFVSGDLAWAYRVKGAIQVNKNAALGVLGEDGRQLLDLAQDAAGLSNSLGAGASMFGSSNANYGDLLGLWAQDTGKKTHLMIQKATAAAMDTLGPVAMRMRANKKAAAEVGIVTNILRSTDDKYVWAAGDPLSGRLQLKELKALTGEKLEQALQAIEDAGRKPYIDIKEPDAIEFLRTHAGMNSERVSKRTLLNNAKGMQSNYDPEVVYVPPIDTTYFQHFAFVRPIDKRAFSTSEVSMVFGRDAAELQKRMAMIDRNNFDVITKDGTERYFKAKGDYDFDLTINEPRINSELRRTGALNNVFPEVRPETIAEDYLRWHQNQSSRLVRDAVETNYAQQVAELRQLGSSYVEIARSKWAGTPKATSSEIADPFDDYVKTALDVSKRSEYKFLHQANEFVDALGTRAYSALSSAFGKGKEGLISWEEVNAIAERHGIRGPYKNQEELFISNTPRDKNLIKEGITKANMLLANTVLRLDFFNSIVNTVSTPIMIGTELASIRNLLKNEPELLGRLGESLSVKMPGSDVAVPSTTKLIAQAVSNWFGDTGKELVVRYKANGDIKDTLQQMHSMFDNLALRADFKAFSDGTTKAFELGAKITGNNYAEEMTRFISADVMRQITDPAVEAGKLSLKEQNAFISVFTNRVQGNYISSQRPVVFQGVLGSAVSLFQTYSFNLMQQLTRHIANKDKRAVATMLGMQAGLFGLNGTPFFEAVNTHLIGNAAVNQGHYDAYSIAPALLGKEAGDWLMYGTASAFPAFGSSWPALYTRGDINPRHASILPLNPMDIPAFDASRRVVSNLMDVGSKILGGAAVGQTLLQGLEHNGINRPLAGFAQVLAGQSTTSKGSMISASSDFDLVTSAARILGSRPMDEAVALNNMYRLKAYQASDTDRMGQLGERVKTYLYKNQMPDDETMDGFMKDYAKIGGRVENFNRSLQKWSTGANQSVVNKMREKLQSPYGQRLNEIMGGEPLTDWATTQIVPDPVAADSAVQAATQ